MTVHAYGGMGDRTLRAASTACMPRQVVLPGP